MNVSRWFWAALFIIVIGVVPVAAQEGLDPSAEPNFGSVELAAGFAPPPFVVELVSGGDLDASAVVAGCVGFVTPQPDFRLFWGGGGPLRFSVQGNGGDTTLIIFDPQGGVSCNDDTVGRDPVVEFADAPAGEYAVYVGSFNQGEFVEATLQITDNLDSVEGGTDPSVSAACDITTPLADLSAERVDDLTVIVAYTNPVNGQQFELTITGTDADEIDTYLNEAQICLAASDAASTTAAPPPPEEVVDIAFGDIFFDVLEENGFSVDEVVAQRDEGAFEGRTLRDVLNEQGIDGDSIVGEALERANQAIDEALSQGRLSETRARDAFIEVEAMYGELLDLPELAGLAGGRNPALPAFNVEIAIVNAAQTNAEELNIDLVVDPPIGYGWSRSHSYSLPQAQSAKVNSLCATQGAVGGYMYRNTSFLWSRYETTTPPCQSSSWYTANRLFIVGWTSTNYYTLNSTFAVRY